MIPVSVRLKCMVPGFRAKWRGRYSLMLAHLEDLARRAEFLPGGDAPAMRVQGEPFTFHGFAPTAKEHVESHVLGAAVPRAIPFACYRLAKDYVTRYLYPHLRPDLSPEGIGPQCDGGFHGQHKESLADYAGRTPPSCAPPSPPRGARLWSTRVPTFGLGDLHLSRLVGEEGRVFSIEASAACHALLERNIGGNGVGNVVAMHRAIWNEETEMDLERRPGPGKFAGGEVHRGDHTQKVRTVTVDGLVREYGLDRLDMISLTVNGAELEALEGAAESLEAFRPRLRIPGWYSRGGRPISELVARWLEPRGYRVWATPHGNVVALYGGRR